MISHSILKDALIERSFSLDDIEFFQSQFSSIKLEEGESLFSPGERCQRYYILKSGLIKISTLGEDGKEHTLDFVHPGQLSMDILSFVRKEEVQLFYTALTPCELWVSSKDLQELLHERGNEWYEFGIHLLSKLYEKKMRREISFVSMSAKERLEQLKKYSPTPISHIPKKDLASYIGVTPTSFSRLLREL